jgi:DNA modification methylase
MKTGEGRNGEMSHAVGRWPANVVHDGSDEVLEAFAAFGDNKGDGCGKPRSRKPREDETQYRIGGGRFNDTATYSDTGTAARFFYCAKASRKERGEGNTHPTVKPLALMEWLVRLVTPPNGTVLDPFAGSATTGVAALRQGRRFIGIERDDGYAAIAKDRLAGLSFHTGVA